MRALFDAVRRVLLALRDRIGLFFMAQPVPVQTFDEVVTETVAKLEELERQQQGVLDKLREARSRSQGIDEAKAQIDEL